jgi:hypothetical protein
MQPVLIFEKLCLKRAENKELNDFALWGRLEACGGLVGRQRAPRPRALCHSLAEDHPDLIDSNEQTANTSVKPAEYTWYSGLLGRQRLPRLSGQVACGQSVCNRMQHKREKCSRLHPGIPAKPAQPNVTRCNTKPSPRRHSPSRQRLRSPHFPGAGSVPPTPRPGARLGS